MRIAFVCSDKAPCPPVKGGAIQLLISEVAPLLAKNHPVTVYSISDPTLPDREYVDGVQYVRFEKENFLDGVIEAVQRGDFDIIQVHNRPNWILDLHDASPNSKLILSLHNLLYDTVKVNKAYSDAIVQHVDKILTVSSFVAKDTVRRWPKAKRKTTVMYTGVNLDKYEQANTKRGGKWRTKIRERYNIGKDDPVILFVGRLVPYKGCHVVIESLRLLRRKHPNVKLLVVGSKWYADEGISPYIQRLYANSKKMRGAVIFASYVPVEEMPKYYVAADMFVCASQWKEPLARVHYEAMAAGIPIVTTDRGGNGEVVQDDVNGYVIKKYKDPNEFKIKLHKLLNAPKLAKKLGSNGLKLVRKKYNFGRVSSQMESIYKELLTVNR